MSETTPGERPQEAPKKASPVRIILMLALEGEYGFEFSPEEMDEAKSVGQIARLVASKRA